MSSSPGLNGPQPRYIQGIQPPQYLNGEGQAQTATPASEADTYTSSAAPTAGATANGQKRGWLPWALGGIGLAGTGLVAFLTRESWTKWFKGTEEAGEKAGDSINAAKQETVEQLQNKITELEGKLQTLEEKPAPAPTPHLEPDSTLARKIVQEKQLTHSNEDLILAFQRLKDIDTTDAENAFGSYNVDKKAELVQAHQAQNGTNPHEVHIWDSVFADLGIKSAQLDDWLSQKPENSFILQYKLNLYNHPLSSKELRGRGVLGKPENAEVLKQTVEKILPVADEETGKVKWPNRLLNMFQNPSHETYPYNREETLYSLYHPEIMNVQELYSLVFTLDEMLNHDAFKPLLSDAS